MANLAQNKPASGKTTTLEPIQMREYIEKNALKYPTQGPPLTLHFGD